MKPILLVRNDRYESFGVALSALAWARADVLTVDLAAGADIPPLDAVSGVITFGGTVNVDQTDKHPYLARVREYTREAVDRGSPYLGICLGAQILARAMDRPVFNSPAKEVGFAPIHPTPDAKEDPLVSLFVEGDMVFEWHEDTFELPAGATLLATGDDVLVQAYRVGDRAWGIQFHQEVDRVELGWWLDIADAAIDIESVWGKSADMIRAEAARYISDHEERGRELFRRFADEVRRTQD